MTLKYVESFWNVILYSYIIHLQIQICWNIKHKIFISNEKDTEIVVIPSNAQNLAAIAIIYQKCLVNCAKHFTSFLI